MTVTAIFAPELSLTQTAHIYPPLGCCVLKNFETISLTYSYDNICYISLTCKF